MKKILETVLGIEEPRLSLWMGPGYPNTRTGHVRLYSTQQQALQELRLTLIPPVWLACGGDKLRERRFKVTIEVIEDGDEVPEGDHAKWGVW